MSERTNKERLQSNNSALESLIQQAETLPEAGQEVEAETCTGIIEFDEAKPEPLYLEAYVYYVGQDKKINCNRIYSGGRAEITCFKGSNILLQGLTVSSANNVIQEPYQNSGFIHYIINGDFTILYY